jgi:GGDEF domain-containing protein
MCVDAKIEELTQQLSKAVKEMNAWKIRALKAEYEAAHDPMTGVLNRKGLFEAYEASFEEAYNIVYVIDIDGLKTVNDTLGHAEGDRFIKNVANQLDNTAKAADGVVARVGGDEFVLLVKEIISFGNPENFSYGWVCIADYVNLDAALDQADTNMYTRKKERGTRGRPPVQRSPCGATPDLLGDPLVQGV